MSYKPTSPVIKEINDWCDMSFLIPHEVIRWQLSGMVQMTDVNNSFDVVKDPWKLDMFQEWFEDWVFPWIHHHHAVEETIYFPWVEAKAKIPPKLSMDHKELDVKLNEVRAFPKRIASAGSDGEKRKLAKEFNEALKKFQTFMGAHLAQEETDITPIVRKHFTEKEHDAVVQKILKNLGIGGNKVALPQIIYCMENIWGGPKVAADFVSILPPPIRNMYKSQWKKRFEVRCLATTETHMLASGTKPEYDAHPGCANPCSIM